jgi:hypothetical protein
LIKTSKDRHDCLQKIIQFIELNAKSIDVAEPQPDSENSTSWLSDDVRYEKIKKMIDNFSYLPFDLTDIKVAEKSNRSRGSVSY